jgi:hypothetical protein
MPSAIGARIPSRSPIEWVANDSDRRSRALLRLTLGRLNIF